MKKSIIDNIRPLPHKIYDSHAHLTEESLKSILNEVISRAKKNDIAGILLPGDTLQSSRDVIELANTDPDFFRAAVGLHPYDAKFYNDEIEKELIELAKNSTCAAIGEIGLDFREDGSDPSPHDIQREAFKLQMRLGKKLDLPVIIHCRNAYPELISMLEQDEFRGMGGVVHCFSGVKEEAVSLCNLGWHIGFTGTVTFKNAPHLREAAASIPIEKILVETDCPYLTPHPYRGTRPNEPVYVRLVVETISESKNINLEEVCKITSENTRRLFGFR
jgi:TatD DNase family protein